MERNTGEMSFVNDRGTAGAFNSHVLIVSQAQSRNSGKNVHRQGRAEFQSLPRHRMRKRQTAGMQGLPLQPSPSLSAIQFVRYQRMTERGHVNPDLVRSACVQFAANQAIAPVTLQH